jgi:hypothetical protein
LLAVLFLKVALECRHDATLRALQRGLLCDGAAAQGAVAPVPVRTFLGSESLFALLCYVCVFSLFLSFLFFVAIVCFRFA